MRLFFTCVNVVVCLKRDVLGGFRITGQNLWSIIEYSLFFNIVNIQNNTMSSLKVVGKGVSQAVESEGEGRVGF